MPRSGDPARRAPAGPRAPTPPARRPVSRRRTLAAAGTLLILAALPAACRTRHRQALPPPPAAEAPVQPGVAPTRPDVGAASSPAPQLPTPNGSLAQLEGTATALAQAVATASRLATGVATAPAGRAATAIRRDPAAQPPADALGLGQGTQGGRLGSIYRLQGLRQGEHPGFTRLVWELRADPPATTQTEGPLWEIVEEANRAEPKAAALLEGCCHIRLRLADTYAEDFVGALSLSPAPSGPVRGTRILPMEDDSSLTFAIDLAEPAPYTVTLLQEPLRVVVDVYRP